MHVCNQPDSSRNVHIEDLFVSNGDDGIALKSGLDQYGRAVGMPTENVFIRNVTTYGRGGIAIGSEMSGGIRNVTVRECAFWFKPDAPTNHKSGFGRNMHIKMCRGRGGYVEEIDVADVDRGASKGFTILAHSHHSGCNNSGPWPGVCHCAASKAVPGLC